MRAKNYSTYKEGEYHEEKPRKKKLYKKRTSFKKLKLVILLVFNRPKEKDRKSLKDLVVEILPVPECVKCTPFFALKKSSTMCACDSKWELEPTNEDLSKIEKELNYLSVA